jgi:hypothetical protein
MIRDIGWARHVVPLRLLRGIFFRWQVVEVAESVLGVAAEGRDEGMGTEQGGNGVCAEVDGPEGGELGLEVDVSFGGSERLKEALVGHADKFDFGGEIGERNLIQQATFSCLEDGRVVAVPQGVVR